MTATVCLYPQFGAVDILGKNRNWKASNTNPESLQYRWLRYFEHSRSEIPNIPEIQCIASWSHEEINEFLASRGYDISLAPFGPGEFGTASEMDVLVKWLKPGKQVRLGHALHRSLYPGVLLKSGVGIFEHSKHDEPIVVIETQNGDKVYMTIHNKITDPLDMVAKTLELERALRQIYSYEGVHFPQVDVNEKPDISWLKGLWTTGSDRATWAISQALQQTKFRMNEEGARAESAVAIGIERLSLPQPPASINRPFLVWIKRSTLSLPFFVGHITEECWKRPKDINEK